jgi:hypothetical protein
MDGSRQVMILKQELVNREENFNNKFASGGGAGLVTANANMPSWMPGADKKPKSAKKRGF